MPRAAGGPSLLLGLGLLVVLVAVAGCLEQAGTGQSLENLTLEDTDEVHPGAYTLLDDGILVGAEPGAIDEPVPVTVEPIDPIESFEVVYEGRDADEILGEGDIRELGTFVEIATTGEERVGARPGTHLYAAFPVPGDLDPRNLHALEYVRGEQFFSPSNASDLWHWTESAYDPDHDLLIVRFGSMGEEEEPTRLGIVEHGTWTTEYHGDTVDILMGEPADPLDGTEHRGVQERPDGADDRSRFGFSARAASGAQLQGGDSIPDWYVHFKNVDFKSSWDQDVKKALDGAFPVYSQLDGDPYPVLKDKWGEDYDHKWYVYEKSFFNGCEDEVRGVYYYDYVKGGKAITCANAWGTPRGSLQAENTTAHELFHAFQRDYIVGGEDVIKEATAQLANEWGTPETIYRFRLPPNIVQQRFHDLSYPGQHFYHHLLRDDPSKGFEDFGGLFQEGKDVEALENWLGGWHGLRDAYWSFAKDFVYEKEHFAGEPRFSNPHCTLSGPFRNNNPVSDLDDIFPETQPSKLPSDGDTPADFTHSFDPPMPDLSTRVLEVPLETYSDPYTVTVTSVSDEQEMDDANWRVKVYDDKRSNANPEACWADDGRESGEFTLAVDDTDTTVYVVTSNMDPTDPDVEHQFTFEPLPDAETPEAESFTVAYEDAVEDWEDHDGSISIDLLAHAQGGGDGDGLVVVSPDEDHQTSDGNWVRVPGSPDGAGEDGVDYELDADPYASYGSYTDAFRYEVQDQEYGLTDSGWVTVERGFSPIAVNDTEDWSITVTEVHPLTNDINPIDYPGSPYASDTDLSIVDVFDVVGGTAVLEADEETVTIDADSVPVGGSPWVECPEGWTEVTTYSTVMSFNYTAENTIRTSPNDPPLGHEDDDGAVDVVRSHEICAPDTEDDDDPYHDVLQPDDPGITFDHCQAFGGAGGPMAMRMQETTRSPAGGSQVRANAYVQPDGGDWTSLAHQADAPGLAATDLSPEGVLGGWMETDAGAQAFTWDPRNGVRELRADGESIVLATHDDGQLGGYALPEDGATEGMIWLDGDPRSVGDRFHGSLVTGVDARGQAVGIHGFTPPSPGGHAGFDVDPCDPFVEGLADTLSDQEPGGFLLDFTETGDPLQGEVTDLGSLGGGTTIPAGHNDAGVVVGVSTLDRGGERAFRWTDGTMEDLGTLGGRTSFARAVDDAGNVVGTSTTRSGEERAFLWQPRDGMTEIDEAVPLPEGSTIVEATAIDDDGRISVTAETRDGIRYPLVVTGLVEGGR